MNRNMEHVMTTERRAPMAVWKTGVFAGLAALAATIPSAASAQAICSAPHSSPTLAQSGSLRTLPAGGGWLQVSAYGQRATEFFSPGGNRQPFLADSEFNTRSVFVTGAVGVTTGFEIWAQVPVHFLDVNSAGGDSESSGIGDVRVAGRIGSELFGVDLPLAARFGAKIPGSDFPVDATVLPLTEGQRDWELSLETGISSQDRPIYLMGWVGYRWREEHKEAARDPGDEAFGHLAFGGTYGNLSLELAGDVLWGAAPVAQGFELPGEKRRLIQVLPTVGWGVGPGRLEATAQVPVWGKNLPVGVGLSIGYRLTWGLEPSPMADLRDFLGSG